MVLAVLTSFDGGRLFGQVHGSGAPKVLALHGWARDHRDFDLVLGGRGALPPNASVVAPRPVAPEKADSEQPGEGLGPNGTDLPLPEEPLASIALDLPGFGATPPPEQAWGTAGYATALAPLLDGLDSPVVLLGHSYGGRVAVHLTAQCGDMVAGLVLTGAPLFAASSVSSQGSGAGDGRSARGPKSPIIFRVGRALARRGLIGEERLESLRQRYGSPDYRAATGVMREVLVKSIAEEREEAYTPSLRAITCPVALFWGERDTAAPPAVAERIAATLEARHELVVVPGVGHFTPISCPGRLRAVLERLVAQQEGSR